MGFTWYVLFLIFNFKSVENRLLDYVIQRWNKFSPNHHIRSHMLHFCIRLGEEVFWSTRSINLKLLAIFFFHSSMYPKCLMVLKLWMVSHYSHFFLSFSRTHWFQMTFENLCNLSVFSNKILKFFRLVLLIENLIFINFLNFATLLKFLKLLKYKRFLLLDLFELTLLFILSLL